MMFTVVSLYARRFAMKDGELVSGSLTLTDARGGPDTFVVTFDVAIPSEIIEC